RSGHAGRRRVRGLAQGPTAHGRSQRTRAGIRARRRALLLLVRGLYRQYCSWFEGSTDNASGDACVLELARVLKAFDDKLRYGICLAWWPGHSHGRYSGSTWYADTNWRELRDNAIVYFNIDSPGVKGATVYVPRHQMAEIAAFNEAMTTDVTGWSTM